MMWPIIEKCISALNGWITLNRENKRITQQTLLDAMIKIQRAANLTRACLAADAADEADTGNNNGRPGAGLGQELRDRVSTSWVEVGEALARCQDNYRDSHIEDLLQELVQKCFQKGAYWANPNGWEHSGVDIQLSTLVQQASSQIDELRRAVRHGRP